MKHFIKVYENAIPHLLCDKLVKKFESNQEQWEKGDKRTHDELNDRGN